MIAQQGQQSEEANGTHDHNWEKVLDKKVEVRTKQEVELPSRIRLLKSHGNVVVVNKHEDNSSDTSSSISKRTSGSLIINFSSRIFSDIGQGFKFK